MPQNTELLYGVPGSAPPNALRRVSEDALSVDPTPANRLAEFVSRNAWPAWTGRIRGIGLVRAEKPAEIFDRDGTGAPDIDLDVIDESSGPSEARARTDVKAAAPGLDRVGLRRPKEKQHGPWDRLFHSSPTPRSPLIVPLRLRHCTSLHGRHRPRASPGQLTGVSFAPVPAPHRCSTHQPEADWPCRRRRHPGCGNFR
jgi:hypothetical protein